LYKEYPAVWCPLNLCGVLTFFHTSVYLILAGTNGFIGQVACSIPRWCHWNFSVT